MQYLVNKTKGSLNLALSPKVGAVKLSPYEARPVDVEQWDAIAFNMVRTLPTKVGLYERVPKDLIEKRKAYIELTQSTIEAKAEKENEQLQQKREQLDNDIKILTEELAKEDKSIQANNEKVEALNNTLENLRTSLSKVSKGSDEADSILTEIKVAEKKYLKAFQALDAQKAEYNQAQLTLEKLQNARKEL